MSARWNDPNLRNHCKDDSGMRISRFDETITFQSNQNSSNRDPYRLDDMHSTQSIVCNVVDNDKFTKYIDILRDSTMYDDFITTSTNKPMADAYNLMAKQPYLYQMILGINGMFNIMDYTADVARKIAIPSNEQLTAILRDLLIENNYRTMHELTHADEIRTAIERLNTCESEFSITDVIERKIGADRSDINGRLTSPLVQTYLKNRLDEATDEEMDIEDRLAVSLRNITRYVRKSEV